jgi:hypothetical protein
MRHNFRSWSIVGFVQLSIIIGGFNLPNNIINSATWYAPLLDFGRIALLFGLPVVNVVFVTNLLAIGKRKKAYLKQFINADNYFKYDSIDPIHFINLTSE